MIIYLILIPFLSLQRFKSVQIRTSDQRDLEDKTFDLRI